MMSISTHLRCFIDKDKSITPERVEASFVYFPHIGLAPFHQEMVQRNPDVNVLQEVYVLWQNFVGYIT